MIDKSIVEKRERAGGVWLVTIAALFLASLYIWPALALAIVLFVIFCAAFGLFVSVSIS